MSIQTAIREIAKPADEVYSVVGVVTGVNANARTCDVRPSNGMADLYDVRIQAAPMGDEGVTYTPKIGSVVVVTFLNRHTGYVAVATELKNWYLICDDVRLGSDMFTQKAVKGEALNERLSAMIAEQKSMVQALVKFAATQQAASIGVLAPLLPGFATLGFALAPMLANLIAIENLLSEHLSEKVKVA